MTEQTLSDARQIVKDAVDASADVKESWLGPRSNELGFLTVRNVTVTLSVRVKELLA